MSPLTPALANPDDAATLVEDRVASRQGMSVVRIGDGEGVMLSRPKLAHRRERAYLTTHFGESISQQRLDALAERLDAAVHGAAIVGIRGDVQAADYPEDLSAQDDEQLVTWARTHLALRSEERQNLDPDSARRLILLGRWLKSFEPAEGVTLTSAWIHFVWLESGFLARLARRLPGIGLVSGRPELVPVFEGAGIDVTFHAVPLKHLERTDAWTPHFPDRYDELLETLQPAFPGQVFFVGAGLCGKVYCDVIARRGGIALDIGAVCDAWLGIASRPRVARHRWGQDAVPQHLLLKHQLENHPPREGRHRPVPPTVRGVDDLDR